MCLILLASCSSGKVDEPPMKPAVPVTVALAVEKTVPVQLRSIGNVEACSTVEIKSQVEGQVKAVHFREGREVAKGSLLFTIDPRPFEADLREAQARKARDEALAEKAEKDAVRYKTLVERDLVSRQQYDQARADAESLRASVKADEAALSNARLRLAYCYIRAPIGGLTGNLVAYAGNLIKANADDPMVLIYQLTPIYVGFTAPERYLAEIRKRMAAGQLGVEATTPEDGAGPARGRLSFVDGAVDSATGTIRLKATFANEDKRLWPGQYVSVTLTLAQRAGAVVVPSQAVQAGQEGTNVFVVRPDETAELRPVTAGTTLGGETVIEKGLRPGERVVTDGQLRLMPGDKVRVIAPGRVAAP
ncbi:MAG: efflux RND transporter periplasmic adaptor subunit [Pseudomonadota bacterium]